MEILEDLERTPMYKLDFDLRDERIKKNLTVREMAEHCGINMNTYYGLESGRLRSIKTENLKKIIEVLNNPNIIGTNKYYYFESLDDLRVNIKGELKARGIYYKDLAKLCGVTITTVYRWCNRETKRIKKESMDKIKEVLSTMPNKR